MLGLRQRETETTIRAGRDVSASGASAAPCEARHALGRSRSPVQNSLSIETTEASHPSRPALQRRPAARCSAVGKLRRPNTGERAFALRCGAQELSVGLKLAPATPGEAPQSGLGSWRVTISRIDLRGGGLLSGTRKDDLARIGRHPILAWHVNLPHNRFCRWRVVEAGVVTVVTPIVPRGGRTTDAEDGDGKRCNNQCRSFHD